MEAERRYSISIVRSARKFLDRLARSKPRDAASIEDAIEALQDDPRPHGALPLKGYANVWRIRIGGYRACYTVDDGRLLVLVVTISTRDDVYAVVRRHLGR